MNRVLRTIRTWRIAAARKRFLRMVIQQAERNPGTEHQAQIGNRVYSIEVEEYDPLDYSHAYSTGRRWTDGRKRVKPRRPQEHRASPDDPYEAGRTGTMPL